MLAAARSVSGCGRLAVSVAAGSEPWRTAWTRCGPLASIPSTKHLHWRGSASSVKGLPTSRDARRTSRRASRPCTAPMSPRRPSPRPTRDYTTRSAMFSAAWTTSHMRRLTPLVLPHVLASTSIPDGDQRMAAAFDAPPSLLPLQRKVRRCRQTRLITTAASDHSRPRADDPRRCPQRRREVILWMDSFATAHR